MLSNKYFFVDLFNMNNKIVHENRIKNDHICRDICVTDCHLKCKDENTESKNIHLKLINIFLGSLIMMDKTTMR